jgi:hypothetical protein
METTRATKRALRANPRFHRLAILAIRALLIAANHAESGSRGNLTCHRDVLILPDGYALNTIDWLTQFLTVIVSESTAFLPDTPSSPARCRGGRSYCTLSHFSHRTREMGYPAPQLGLSRFLISSCETDNNRHTTAEFICV